MKLKTLLLVLVLLVTVDHFAGAAVLYESGTLGPTSITWDNVVNQTVLGANIKSNVFNGVRFQLTKHVVTTQVGGHLVGPPTTANNFFGAIVALENENDFPNSGDLSTVDVLGTTVIAFPEPSAEVFGNLTLSLEPGWYALVFGSGLFGASGNGAMLLNNPDIGSPTYIGFQPGAVLGWGNLLNPIFRNYRFVIRGHVVSEPGPIPLVTLIVAPLFFVRAPSREYSWSSL